MGLDQVKGSRDTINVFVLAKIFTETQRKKVHLPKKKKLNYIFGLKFGVLPHENRRLRIVFRTALAFQFSNQTYQFPICTNQFGRFRQSRTKPAFSLLVPLLPTERKQEGVFFKEFLSSGTRSLPPIVLWLCVHTPKARETPSSYNRWGVRAGGGTTRGPRLRSRFVSGRNRGSVSSADTDRLRQFAPEPVASKSGKTEKPRIRAVL